MDRQRHDEGIYCANQFELFKITYRQMQHAIFPWIKTLYLTFLLSMNRRSEAFLAITISLHK